jgi:hypothetical protein
VLSRSLTGMMRLDISKNCARQGYSCLGMLPNLKELHASTAYAYADSLKTVDWTVISLAMQLRRVHRLNIGKY